MTWKKGRGKLGAFDPLLGSWAAEEETPRGRCRITRTLERTLDGKYLELRVHWKCSSFEYDELAIIGVNEHKEVAYWSFTSDGKRAEGALADVTDLHPQAVGFEAQMPAGLARQAYFPHDERGFTWVVESKTKKGWKRFVEQHYRVVR